jgi:quercetin dioxygenase-like cupin family protein
MRKVSDAMPDAPGDAVLHPDGPVRDGPAYWVGNTEFVTLKLTGNETGGNFALAELVAMPGAEPPPHIHHGTDETYYVLEGEFAVLHGDRTYTATAGSVVYLPQGTLHAWRNATAALAKALLLITPAGFENVIPVVGKPGTLAEPPPPPPPPTEAERQRIEELGRKYETEYPAGITW